MKLTVTRYYFLLTWTILSAFVLVFAFTSPINVDEVLHYDHAEKVVDWYVTGGHDASCLNTPNSNLKYYGQSMDNVTAFINRAFSIKNKYLTHHLIGCINGIFLLLVIGLIAVEVSGNFAIAILAMLLFFISPRPMGQLVNNLKDIPFALGYAWSIFIMIRIFKGFPTLKWKQVWQLGLAIAFTNSVRIGGLVLLPYFGLFTLFMMMGKPETFSSIHFWKNWLPKSLMVAIIGYSLGLLLWPYALLNPFTHPIESLQIMEHYKISIRQIFEGKWIWSTALPWYYLPRWLIISIPEIVWVGIGLYLLNSISARFIQPKRKHALNISQLILAFGFLFPAIYVIAIHANLYSGWRQMYFIYPTFVVLSAMGIHASYQHFKGKGLWVFSAFLVVMAIQPSTFIFKNLNPDYVYFNATAEGNKGAFGVYEYDYYWHHLQPVMKSLDKSFKGDTVHLKIACNFDLSCYSNMDDRFEFTYIPFMERNKVDYDYAILELNYLHPYQLKNNTWQPGGIIHQFNHRKNPSVVVIKHHNDDALEAHKAYRAKDYKKATVLFEKALRKDWYDLNLRSYLSKCYLIEGNTKQFLKINKRGRHLNPYYEPLRILMAEFYHRDGSYDMARIVLERLLKDNPRYTKAVGMLADCYEKLGNTEKLNELNNTYKIN